MTIDNREAGVACTVKVLHMATADVTLQYLLLPQVMYLVGQGFDVTMLASTGKCSDELRARVFYEKYALRDEIESS